MWEHLSEIKFLTLFTVKAPKPIFNIPFCLEYFSKFQSLGEGMDDAELDMSNFINGYHCFCILYILIGRWNLSLWYKMQRKGKV